MNSNFQVFVLRNRERVLSNWQSELLLKQAALSYGVSQSKLADEKVLRSGTGKPFFKNLNVCFSISHSKNVWACIIGPYNCGLDVQFIRPCNFNKIAGRFFSEEEINYVNQHGVEGFFDIWVRREAYGKYTGEGFFGNMPKFVSPDESLIEYVENNQEQTCLREIYIGEKIKSAVCVPSSYMGAIDIKEDWYHEDNVFIG